MNQSNNPNREPARDRFATDQRLLDLGAEAQKLLEEPQSGPTGHRQIALHKTSNTTLALFAFDAGGHMPQHRAHGTVIIQVLKGRLRVATPDAEHALSAGQVLVLAPDVPHDVNADDAAQMLLTVSRLVAT